ncbi:hypothetical protein HDV00_010543, partial [Rhizophlyctis rosea]
MDPPQTRLVTTAGYDPVQPDEMKLAVGDVVVVLHSYDDGWIYGRNLSTSAMGLVPRNFLKSEGPGPASTTPGFINPNAGGSPKPSTSTPSPTSASPISPLNLKTPGRTVSMDLSNAGIPLATALANAHNPPPSSASSSPTSSIRQKTPLKTEPEKEVKPVPVKVPEPVTAEEAKKKLQMARAWRTVRAPVAANIGAVKIMVVGDSGIGKTALIHSLISLVTPDFNKTLPKLTPTTNIAHHQASTILPTELRYHEDPNNLTFIDTPGFGTTVDALSVIKPVVDHVTSQFQLTHSAFSPSINPAQLTKFLTAGTDIEFMKRLSLVVNVVPVLLKCDTLRREEVYRLKTEVLESVARSQVEMYKFGLSHGECLALAKGRIGGAIPFAISSVDVVDAIGGVAGVGGGASGGASGLVKGTPVGDVDETEELKFNLFYAHLDDLRRATAEKFA